MRGRCASWRTFERQGTGVRGAPRSVLAWQQTTKSFVIGEPVEFWAEGASRKPRATCGSSTTTPERNTEERRDAHYRVQRWAQVLPWQIERLHASRLAAMDAHENMLASGHYSDERRWPFMQMDAEAHFARVAARQLLRALRAFDGNDRLPDGLTNAQVRDVRDALGLLSC
jgi:hypothetical protein